MSFRKVERKQAKLRMALTGVSNSGKTMGALKIAKGMGGKIFFINTEKEGPDVYDDLFEDTEPCDVWDINAPYSPEKYIEAIDACEKAGADIIIIDSLSHAWAGTGGILDIQDAKTKASNSKNSYTAWRDVTPLHNRLVDKILQSSAHVIATMRSKTQHEIVEINGKKSPIKIGLAPIQRDGLEYEFTLMMEMEHSSHLFTASKDRTRIFEGRNELLTEKHGQEIVNWLNKGKSFQEVEKEEQQLILSNIENTFELCETIDSLKSIYFSMFTSYPKYSNEIMNLKDIRKAQLESVYEDTSRFENNHNQEAA